MKKVVFSIIVLILSFSGTYSQVNKISEQRKKDSIAIVNLQNQINQINDLYKTLKTSIDNTKNQTDQGFQSINKKFEKFSESIETNYGKIDSRTEKIETNLKISDKEKNEFIAKSIDRNQVVQENFYQYIKFYGDKYSQLDEKVTSEELSLELRRIINPQSGSLGFKLSDRLYKVMKKNFYSMTDEIVVNSNKKKNDIKSKIDNTLQAVTSILDNEIVNDVVGIIPYGTNIKNIIGTVSGLMVNLFDSKLIKSEFQNKFLHKIKKNQETILSDMNEIIAFYDKMAKIDNEYQITLQTIRNDVDILGIELREFCISMETPLKKIDPSFSIDKTKSIREITIQLSNKFELMEKDKKLIGNNLSIMTNMSSEIKSRSRILYNRYREIQESKINANNEFVKQFRDVIEKSKISANSNDLVEQLTKKNQELIDKMNKNHAIDKKEFEKWLVKISELN